MSRILIKNCKALIQCGENLPNYRSGEQMSELPILENAFLAIEDDRIVEYGSMEEWGGISDWRGVEVIDAENRYILPAFCDSHTHLVFAKSREEEFVDRIKGLSYEEIAAKGGGILNSARRLREMSEDELFEQAMERVRLVNSYGTGALEIKSGYGLSVEGELKMLRVVKRIKESVNFPVKATFLGAHAYPAEYKQDHRTYLDMVIKEMLPVVREESLADYIDVFCERNYFSLEEMTEVLQAGIEAGLRPKVHVNQFSVMGGIPRAVELGALSVDHLEEIADDDIEALKGSSCMATLLPSCSHFINIPFAPARRLIDSGLAVALASDFNPGTTPTGNLQTVMSLACIKQRMTPEEAINALTLNAAYAMDLSEEMGSISLGKRAKLVMTKEIPSLAYLPYAFGDNHIERTIGF
ncbi:MAG: imidazolonepropionase [Bacteroidetes bacterium]|nr:MAG: imidazolonepropionase [Bacteroidota bacterium]